MGATSIGWTDKSWNPWSGCTEVSPGCDNCYARVLAERWAGAPAFPNGFDLTIRPQKFEDPLKWKTPCRIFVNSTSDFFLGTVPVEHLITVWNVMLEADWHDYQILTKRPIPAARLIKELRLELPPHIWMGVSVENQYWAEQRIPALLEIPAHIRFLSGEPLLGLLDVSPWLQCNACGGTGSDYDQNWVVGGACNECDGTGLAIHWFIDGGESGPNRRPAAVAWFRANRDVCQTFRVPYFHKQGNANAPGQNRELDGRTWDEYPETARVVAA